MTFNLSSLNDDPAKVQDGVVVNLGPGAWIRIAPLFGPKFALALEEAARKYRRNVRSLTPDRKRDLRLKALAKGVILDWDGLTYTDDDGAEKPIGPYTPKKALNALRRLPGFVEEVEERANDRSLFR